MQEKYLQIALDIIILFPLVHATWTIKEKSTFFMTYTEYNWLYAYLSLMVYILVHEIEQKGNYFYYYIMIIIL